MMTPILAKKVLSFERRKDVQKIAMEMQKELVKINFENT